MQCMANNKQCTWFIPAETNSWSCEVERIGSLQTRQKSMRGSCTSTLQPPNQRLGLLLVIHPNTNYEDIA